MKSKGLAAATAAACLLTGLAAGAAQAAVTYSFESGVGQFTYIAADFVSEPLELATGDLKACQSEHGNCLIRFFPELFYSETLDILSFEVFVPPMGPAIETPYRFARGTFRTPGVHVLGGEYAATLTISGAPGPLPTPGVPEPGTWALMIAGFGLAGGALRRRQPAAA